MRVPTTDSHASMADVARLAGVSVSTVSRALRGSSLVSVPTTERVRAAADELSFAISRAASGLASGRVGRVGLVLAGPLQAWFNAVTLEAVWSRLAEDDIELTLFWVRDEPDRERFFTQLPARRNADALIVASFILTEAERQRLDALGMPVVYLNHRVPGVASVAIDDEAAARAGTRALLELGHRRVTFVRQRPPAGFAFSASHRVDGYRSAMSEAGVGRDEQHVLTTAGLAEVNALAAELMALRPRPTAVLAEYDGLALALLGALARQGVAIPADLSLLGFDGEDVSEHLGLSTVTQPAAQIAAEAAGMALALAAGRELDQPNVLVPTRVVLRETTGSPLP